MKHIKLALMAAIIAIGQIFVIPAFAQNADGIATMITLLGVLCVVLFIVISGYTSAGNFKKLMVCFGILVLSGCNSYSTDLSIRAVKIKQANGGCEPWDKLVEEITLNEGNDAYWIIERLESRFCAHLFTPAPDSVYESQREPQPYQQVCPEGAACNQGVK